MLRSLSVLPLVIGSSLFFGLTRVAGAEFCADLQAKYGSAILRCVDFAEARDAAVNWSEDGKNSASTHLFDRTMTATGTQTGTLRWRIRSYDQVKKEEPGLTNGAAWHKALWSHFGVWQRWIGIERYTPGQTYFFQFKFRFNSAYKTQWGGGGPKVMGLDFGCRTVNGKSIPTICEQLTGAYPVTQLGTASSMEFATMSTVNWFPRPVPNAAKRPYPIMYRGSANFALTQGLSPRVRSSQYGTSPMEQPGPDTGWSWNGSAMVNTCNGLDRYHNPDIVWQGSNPPCVTYGEPDVWHEITVALRPSGHFYNTNPAAPAAQRVQRHDTMLKAWYDGRLFINFDPDEPPFRKGQPSGSECAAQQPHDFHPAYDDCHTGLDLFNDSRDVPPNSAYCVYSCGANDPGADVTQFILWTFSYRRGRASQAWCDSVIGRSDPYHRECRSLASSREEDATFEQFLHHREVNVYMDDWVVSTVPLPIKQRGSAR